MNCPHGLDERFCSICNRVRGSTVARRAGHASLDQILEFLNDEQVRATYGAVAEVLGVIPRSLGVRLGPRRPEASWIVSAESGSPTDYSQDQWHPALLGNGDIIKSGTALILRLSMWRRARREG
jgi:hypothetical protein